ncbi:hypothetical protein PUN28_002127 [Cardiocondyla obscurior]|uniref:Uncharacterized protein n=1 Tax=Cardiocondyla obscurior TaxID=286306 RepID=A0AAW2GSU5_9HYME
MCCFDECKQLSQFQEIFYLTCVVGLQNHEDAEIDHFKVRTARDAKKKLENCIAIQSININTNKNNYSEYKLKHSEDEHISEFDENNSCIDSWVDKLSVAI